MTITPQAYLFNVLNRQTVTAYDTNFNPAGSFVTNPASPFYGQAGVEPGTTANCPASARGALHGQPGLPARRRRAPTRASSASLSRSRSRLPVPVPLGGGFGRPLFCAVPNNAGVQSTRTILPPGPGERDTVAAGVRWRSREIGGRGDPVLFVHGMLASSATWQDVLAGAAAATRDRGRSAGFRMLGSAVALRLHGRRREQRSLCGYLDARGIRTRRPGRQLARRRRACSSPPSARSRRPLVLVDPATPQAISRGRSAASRIRGVGETALALAPRPVVAYGCKHRLYSRGRRA